MSIDKEIIIKNSLNQHSFMDLSDLRLEKLNSYKGWYCHNGRENLNINHLGDIYGSVCNSGGKLGNILEGNFKLNSQPIRCPLATCHCGSDIKIKKTRNNSEAASESSYIDTIANDDIVEFDGNFDLRQNKTIFIDWIFGKRCNFDCAYCPADVHDNVSPHITEESFANACKNFANLIADGYKLKLTITGGEPTINPNYLDYLIKLKDMFGESIRLITNTNGSRNWSYFSELTKYSALFFSIHIDYIDISKYIDKIKKITQFRVKEDIINTTDNFFILKIMATPENYNRCVEFYKKIYEFRSWWNDVQVHIEPIVQKEQNYKILNFTDEERGKLMQMNQHDKCFTDYMKSVMYKHKPEIINPKYEKLVYLSEELSINFS